jgi:hypothetical protein
MAVAISKPTDIPENAGQMGPLRVRIWDLTFSGSYAATGETISPASVGLKTIIGVIGGIKEAAAATSFIPVYWNPVTGKLQLYESAAAASPLGEKGAEAYAASSSGRITFFGT